MSASVDDYRIARHAQLLRLEAYAGTQDRSKDDAQGFYSEAGDGGAGREQPLTWKLWLRQTRQAGPSPEEELAVLWGAVWESVAECQDLEDRHARAIAQANSRRDQDIAALAAAGLTYSEIGARLGISKQRVGQYVERSKR